VIEAQLRGLQLLAAGRSDEAAAALTAASKDEDAMPIEFGPPFVDKPTHELLGYVLLALNRAQEAADEYRAALVQTPNRASATRGLANATRRQKGN
jgi:predicted negative regulator of RcsB-dependent stress response